MELLYIWIEDYKNIKRQGFNFSPLYGFEFIVKEEKDGKVISGELKDNIKDEVRAKRESHYKDFFGKGISNVTAIVGENGSGKTTLMQFIRQIFNSAIFENKEGIIVILKNKEDVRIYGYAKLINNLDDNNGKMKKKFIKENAYGGFSIPFATHDVIKNFSPRTVYYSNIFDGKHEIFNERFVEEIISTNFLINEGVEAHYSKEIFRQLNFILNSELFAKLSTQIKYPDTLILSINTNLNSDIIERLGNNKIPKLKETLEEYEKLFKNRKENQKGFYRPDSFENALYEGVFCNFLSRFKGSGENWLSELNSVLVKNLSNAKKDYLNESIEKIIYEYNQKSLHFNHDLNLDIITFFKQNLEKGVFERGYTSSLSNYESISIKIHLNKDEIKDFLTKYLKALSLSYIDFDWGNMSTGEKALLNLYSRFYSIVEKKVSNHSLIVLIDEGELGLHPNWQKNYLHSILNILPQMFDGKNLQFIFASHSPFLVSDLPKENVIFLEKDVEGLCQVSDLEKHKATFGANIHTLFTDSFFMKGGLIGDFAAEKINEAINILENTEPLNTEKIQFCEFIIGIIGEPILKRQLQKMLESKRLQKNDKKIDKHENEIDELKKRIAELELKTKNL